ncbi:Tfp pilus assembly protein PilV [Anaerohalosphaera lusitana]|uniref:Tfp pilus assembly protein PilV n=1 Tax=Anaerohalosphaera lusitana TaxID=1936003 RepID=A0A1U9NKY7_9BACT|nr:type II secretion system protein [Anaerohalosphaera lusitana]AQT68176.1 Tfp pilus assembly protein PilV [Anaerohalosphaera lusitana]
MRTYGKNKGFSLVETVAASVLLSLAVVTLSTISTRSVLNVKNNREYEQAWEILNRQLTYIDYMGVEAFMEQGEFSGKLGDEESGETVHEWAVDINESSDYTGLYSVDIKITWGPERGRRSVSASTLLNEDTSESELELLETQPE